MSGRAPICRKSLRSKGLRQKKVQNKYFKNRCFISFPRHLVYVKRLPQQAFDTVKTEVKKTDCKFSKST